MRQHNFNKQQPFKQAKPSSHNHGSIQSRFFKSQQTLQQVFQSRLRISRSPAAFYRLTHQHLHLNLLSFDPTPKPSPKKTNTKPSQWHQAEPITSPSAMLPDNFEQIARILIIARSSNKLGGLFASVPARPAIFAICNYNRKRTGFGDDEFAAEKMR